MHNNEFSADKYTSFSKNMENMKNAMNEIMEYEAEKAVQPFKQTKELQKQTDILSEAKELTNKSAEHVKKLIELTEENAKSAEKQAKSSKTISVVATIFAFFSLVIAMGSLIYGVISSINSEKIYREQIKNQEEIILQLQDTNNTIKEGNSAIKDSLNNFQKQIPKRK